MYMNLKHKRISFNTTTITSLEFIAPLPPPKILGPPLNLAPPPKFNLLLRFPHQLFCSEIFRSPPP